MPKLIIPKTKAKNHIFFHLAPISAPTHRITQQILQASIPVNALSGYWQPHPTLTVQGEAAIRQSLEIKHNAVPGTYRFLERCRELNVHPELRLIERIDRASDQTEITLPADAPEELKQRLHDISRTQDIDSRTAESYWGSAQWEENGF